MSVETEKNISGWTVDTLKMHYDQRFVDNEKAVTTALVANEKRLDALNELRQGVATTAQIEALEKVVDELKDRLNRNDGRGTGYSQSWAIFVALATLLLAVLYLIFRSKT